jgi:hypothetical protein
MATRREFLTLTSAAVPFLRPGAALLAQPFAHDARDPATRMPGRKSSAPTPSTARS